MYTAKFKHCLNRAVSLIKSEVHRTLQETTSQINLAVIQQNIQLSSVTNMSSSAAVFPIIYGKFSAGVAKLKKLFAEVEKRRNGWPE